MDSTITYHRIATEPDVVRDPGRGTAVERTRRAVLLLLLTLFVPGAAQLTAGSRRIGRIALAVTVGCWFTALLALVMVFTMRGVLLTMLTQAFVMWLVGVVLAVLAIGWLILWLDTFRLIRFSLLAPGARPVIAIALVVLMLLTSGVLGYGSHVVNQGRGALGGLFGSGPSIPAVDGRYNFLLIGADAGEGREGLRPDSIHVASVNEKTGESIIISIPRNFQNAQFSEDSPLWDVYPEGYNCGNECIINFLYTDVTNDHADLYPDADDPGAEAMMDAVSGTLDLEVSGYVMVDMDGFAEIIDAMGGVTVESGGWVPYRGDTGGGDWGDAWWGPGEYTFNGEDALSYARSRKFSSDYNRIQRQQCIQQAMLAQFSPQTVLTKFGDLMEAGGNIAETNLPQSQLGSFIDLAADAQEHDPQRLVLGAPDFGDAGELFSTYPDFDQIHQRVDELIQEESASASAVSPGLTPFGLFNPTTTAVSSSTAGPIAADAAEDDEPPIEETTPPTKPDGSELTVEYLSHAQEAGQTEVLEEAASTNYLCDPVQ